ncbi:MAG: hypothetical protein Q4F49_02195 [Pseudoxanthomonas suwonensis]|nr:hypothetical protein [Pseudoxanthomonas suwonensis]
MSEPELPRVPDPVRNRNRALLLAIVALFLGSFVLAGVLRFSGWQPDGLRNRGELLQPPADLREAALRRIDGTAYDWNPVERNWRILVAPPADCAVACDELARQLDLVWQLFGKDADRVDVLWLGAPPAATEGRREFVAIRPDPFVRARLPRVDGGAGEPSGVPAYVVDPNGFVILRYPAGFDPGDLRSDVARLLKLK